MKHLVPCSSYSKSSRGPRRALSNQLFLSDCKKIARWFFVTILCLLGVWVLKTIFTTLRALLKSGLCVTQLCIRSDTSSYWNEWSTISIWCLNNGATFISDDLFDISFVIAAQYTEIQFSTMWKELCFWGLEEENGKSCLIALILPWITINYLDSNCQNFPPRGQMNTKEFSNDFLIKIF